MAKGASAEKAVREIRHKTRRQELLEMLSSSVAAISELARSFAASSH